MKHISLILLLTPLFVACNQIPDYQLSASTLHIKELQILDPQAPVSNDGIVNGISGIYGENIIKSYHQTTYDAKTARDIEQAE
ncbi:hypothetical protein [Moritella sp. F3]|uniref:hypothetical protein n=1 Tax=Moritella TaxID=58050 RepID=UPI0018E18CFB|nr:hypothetical protein [Moritella sp. F3]GIC79617.1 hypothetical protein FMO001_43440 [Moritella sp. F1]GIC83553.1 hypothetical protein FMO003_38330 [Moritella sp. F3]